MTYDAIVCCGSRALAGTDGESWARRVLTVRIAELPPGGTVYHGACVASPDAWAGEIAIARGDLKVYAFHADGRHEAHAAGLRVWGTWRVEVRKATTWEHFKERNMAMVNAARYDWWHEARETLVMCLASRDSRTKGGPWTAEYAYGHGMDAMTWVWP